MTACPSCARENPDDARFCSTCGAQLAAPEPARESRKVVSILFCDLVGSTALGESTDPEALRGRMRRYFADLRAIIERHGGVVEKFVGDAVMAVFGIPVAHEDDALRAVRAAAEMRVAITGHGLEARIGINTGEVVVGGEGETLVTGDAVNVAARLEQAAGSGEALIGGETRRLVRNAVRVEPVEPLTLKGKSEPVEAFRLVEVIADADALLRHPEAPLVGRTRERERLWRDFEDAVTERTCRLFTLLGPAGIGKSRLVADFLDRVSGDADVLRGRCLHYGEGITYWPLVEILVAIGVEPDSVIGTSPPETQLAFRRLLETRAAGRPQVVVIDDLQWAEPVFVDLVEHVADFSRDAPIFLLCVARTELLDRRQGWGGGKMNASSILLEPLKGEDCDALIDNLLAGALLDVGTRDRIAVASEGNPLFVEEMLAMVREHGGDGEIVVPPTIHALLQAQLDTLGIDERVVIERGSVEGEVFHRGAVAELAPDPMRPALGSHLATLVRKELIRSVAPTFPDDEGFRFRHLLIRDAAYESLPKATRSRLHEQFADWLGRHDLVERDEILGYHLEQAHRYRAELDSADTTLVELGERAADRLGAAGFAAKDRGDWSAARGLFQRARSLLPAGDDRLAPLALQLALVLEEAGLRDEALLVAREIRSATDPVMRARGIIVEFDIESVLGAEIAGENRQARRDEARAVLEEERDHLGLALYWNSVGWELWGRCRAMDALAAWERALSDATAGGGRETRDLRVSCFVLGPMPVAVAVEQTLEILGRSGLDHIHEADALQGLGVLRSMSGEVDEGRELLERGIGMFREAGMVVAAAGMCMRLAFIARRSGDLVMEERVLASGFDELDRLGDRSFGTTVALEFARCLYDQGRYDEAAALCVRARESTLSEDLANFVMVDSIEGALLAREGRVDEAERVGRRGLELAETTDLFQIRGMYARSGLAEVLSLAGKRGEASATAAEAIAIHDDKGDVTGSAFLRRRFESMGIEVG